MRHRVNARGDGRYRAAQAWRMKRFDTAPCDAHPCVTPIHRDPLSSMPVRLDPDLARDIEVRLEDLLAAVDRWSAPLADTLDRVVDDSAGPLEDLLRSVQSGRPAHEDELAVLRAERALTSLLLELAGLAAALRLGPPATAAYRLRALIGTAEHGNCRS